MASVSEAITHELPGLDQDLELQPLIISYFWATLGAEPILRRWFIVRPRELLLGAMVNAG